MQIHFYATMRTIIGMSSLELKDDHVDSFRKLLMELVKLHPDTAIHLLDSNGGLRADVPVYVDGRNPRLLDAGIDAPLRPDSVISFFSPISSGKMNVEVMRQLKE